MRALATVVAVVGLAVLATTGGAPAQESPASCNTEAFRGFAMHPGTNANVWYDQGSPGGKAAAARIAAQIDGRIWPAFARLLGRTPPADDGVPCFHGPDGKLDVYLTTARQIGPLRIPQGTVALAHPLVGDDPCAPRQPDFVVARPGAPRWVIAHELFHAFQAAYGRAQHCIHYHEWEEATATWAADFVYPRDDIEHNHPGAIERPDVALHFWGYATWVFPYYLTKMNGDTSVIRRIEEAGEALPNDAHVDKSIAGGFKQRFPEFALYAWNQDPLPRTDKIKRTFRQWDRIRDVPRPGKRDVAARRLKLGRHAKVEVDPWPVRLPPLARDYRHYTIADDDIGMLRFVNPRGQAVGVTAFVRIARRGWRVQTWTGKDRVDFCLERPGENVREVIVALSNTDYDARLSATAKVEAFRQCGFRYTHLVSISGRLVNHWTIDDPDTCGLVGDGTVTVDFKQEQPAKANVAYTIERRWVLAVPGPFAQVVFPPPQKVVGTVTRVDNTIRRPEPGFDCEDPDRKSGCGTGKLDDGLASVTAQVGDRRRMRVRMVSEEFSPATGGCEIGGVTQFGFPPELVGGLGDGRIAVTMPVSQAFTALRGGTTATGSAHEFHSETDTGSHDPVTWTNDVTRTVTVTFTPL